MGSHNCLARTFAQNANTWARRLGLGVFAFPAKLSLHLHRVLILDMAIVHGLAVAQHPTPFQAHDIPAARLGLGSLYLYCSTHETKVLLQNV
jgi:hypothetical protein